MLSIISVALLLLLCTLLSCSTATPLHDTGHNTLVLPEAAALPHHGRYIPSGGSTTLDLFSTSSPSVHTHPHLTSGTGSRLRQQHLSAPGPPQPDYCDSGFSDYYHNLEGNYSVSLLGQDLPGMPLQLPNNATSVQCALLCILNTACASWSFAPINSYCKNTNNLCWLKSGIPAPTHDVCRISGTPPIHANTSYLTGDEGIDRRNADLTSFPINGSASDCAIECMKLSGCYYWAYEPAGPECTGNPLAFCWLKGQNADGPTPASCRTSGLSALAMGWQPPAPTPPAPPSNLPYTTQTRLDYSISTHTTIIGRVSGDPVTLPDNSTAADCALLCVESLTCQGWVYSIAGCSGDATTCQLYAGVYMQTAMSPWTCTTSGRAVLHYDDAILAGNTDADRVGADMPNMPIVLPKTATAQDCGWLCFNTSGCVSWSYTDYSVNKSQPISVCPSLSSPHTSVPGGCYLKSAIAPLGLDVCKTSGVAWANLSAPAYPLLPSTAIKPTGWLRTQLQLQAAGQAGALPHFYCDVQSSVWLGGSCDGGFAERFSYWINGQLVGSYLINDTEQIQYAEAALEYILSHQQRADGWLRPSSDDPWGISNVLFALVYYYEHHPEKTYIITAIYRFYHALFARLFVPTNWRSDYGWFYVRSTDYVLNLQWLYDNIGEEPQFLLDTMEMLILVTADWKYYFRCAFPSTPQYTFDYLDHGVNNGQGLKSSATNYRVTHSDDDVAFTYERIRMLDQYHGTAHGSFTGDEFLAGTSPTRGIEVCAVVEQMFSYSTLFSVFGNVTLADRLEMVSFNSYAGTTTKEMYAHPYTQMANGFISDYLPNVLTANVAQDGNVYGLDPDDGCCTANHPQGWPKLSLATFMQYTQYVTNPGIVHAVLVSGEVETVLSHPMDEHGNAVHLIAESTYPFSITPTVTYTITVQYTIPFAMRIPAWAIDATVTEQRFNYTYPATAGEVYLLFVDPTFGPNQVYTLKFSTRFHTQRRVNQALSVYYGSLLFALPVQPIEHLYRPDPYHTDWRAFRPDSVWNWALEVNEQDLGAWTIQEYAMNPAQPWDIHHPPLVVSAPARVIQWGVQRQVPEVAPASPVNESLVLSDTQLINLAPYGSTLIRISELPTVAPQTPAHIPTRSCVSSTFSHSQSIHDITATASVEYDFTCSPYTNATANFVWNAGDASSGHTGLAVFDGYQHWIDLIQPNNGLDGEWPSVTGGALSLEFWFYPTNNQGGYCWLDVCEAVAENNILLCLDKSAANIAFSTYVNGSVSTLTAATTLNDSYWHHLVATVAAQPDRSAVLSVYMDGVAIGTLKNALLPPLLSTRNTASIARQSAPGNGDLQLFTGSIDVFRYYNYSLNAQEVYRLNGQSSLEAIPQPVRQTELVVE